MHVWLRIRAFSKRGKGKIEKIEKKGGKKQGKREKEEKEKGGKKRKKGERTEAKGKKADRVEEGILFIFNDTTEGGEASLNHMKHHFEKK